MCCAWWRLCSSCSGEIVNPSSSPWKQLLDFAVGTDWGVGQHLLGPIVARAATNGPLNTSSPAVAWWPLWPAVMADMCKSTSANATIIIWDVRSPAKEIPAVVAQASSSLCSTWWSPVVNPRSQRLWLPTSAVPALHRSPGSPIFFPEAEKVGFPVTGDPPFGSETPYSKPFLQSITCERIDSKIFSFLEPLLEFHDSFILSSFDMKHPQTN